MKKRRMPLSDTLTLVFVAAVCLMWIFSEDIGADPIALLVLSVLSVVLVINWIANRKNRAKLEEAERRVKKAREHIGELDDVEQKDKYYF